MKPLLLLALVLLLVVACAAAGEPRPPTFDLDCTRECAAWWTRPGRSDADRAAVACECRSRPSAYAWGRAR